MATSGVHPPAQRMRRFTWLLATVIACAIAVCVCIQLTLPTGAGINLGNADKIQQGMTIHDVQSILGVGPGDFSGSKHPGWLTITEQSLGTWNACPPSHIWFGEEISIGIWLDAAGLVARKYWVKHAFQGERFFDSAKKWIGL